MLPWRENVEEDWDFHQNSQIEYPPSVDHEYVRNNSLLLVITNNVLTSLTIPNYMQWILCHKSDHCNNFRQNKLRNQNSSKF